MGQIMQGKLRQIQGLQLVVTGDSGHAVVMDQSREVGGFEAAPSPMEFVLFGLAGCTAMDVISILQKKREDVRGFEVYFRAERADEHPKVFTKVHLKFIVKGKGVKPQSVKRAIELSATKYCSASAMISKTADITYEFEIIESD